MKRKNKKGSAIIVVVITAVVFLIYTASTFADISHLKKMHEKYFNNIYNMYEIEYNYLVNNI